MGGARRWVGSFRRRSHRPSARRAEKLPSLKNPRLWLPHRTSDLDVAWAQLILKVSWRLRKSRMTTSPRLLRVQIQHRRQNLHLGQKRRTQRATGQRLPLKRQKVRQRQDRAVPHLFLRFRQTTWEMGSWIWKPVRSRPALPLRSCLTASLCLALQSEARRDQCGGEPCWHSCASEK